MPFSDQMTDTSCLDGCLLVLSLYLSYCLQFADLYLDNSTFCNWGYVLSVGSMDMGKSVDK